MAHPGRPRGRTNKLKYAAPPPQALPHSEYNPHIHANSQYIPPQHQQAAVQTNHPRSREEVSIQVQDEADLILFRQDALQRYITNHEYIENITAKCTHTNKIIPPSLYPILPKREDKIEDLKYDEIYFGDVELMNAKTKQILDQIKQLGVDQYVLGDEYTYQSQTTDKLTELCNEGSVETLERELDDILQDYTKKHSRNYICTSEKKYSIELKKITNKQPQVAPSDYNPKLIDSFLNIDDNDEDINEAGIENNDDINTYENGMFMNYDNHSTNEYTNGSLNNVNMNITDIPSLPRKSLEGINNFNGDMNALFKDPGVEEDSGVVDDMGDLINFDSDNDNDNEMINVGNFEQGFLGEMSHGIE